MQNGNGDEPPVIARVDGSKSQQRWWLHLLVLSAYPLVLGILPEILTGAKERTLLPSQTGALLVVIAFELGVFALIFGVAWYASHATRDDLLLRWNGGSRPVWRGLIGSVLLRVAVSAVLVGVVLAAMALSSDSKDVVEKLRPRTEVVIDRAALVGDPVYFILVLTLVSFVVGGLREELWRAGMLAGMKTLFPEKWNTVFGRLAGVGIAAVIFGIGHLPQGGGGAAVTALLGFGLGLILIYYQSVWEAVFAHGFFNATSFLLLYFVASAQG